MDKNIESQKIGLPEVTYLAFDLGLEFILQFLSKSISQILQVGKQWIQQFERHSF